MKKIFLLLLTSFLYLSCSKESETEDIILELLPVSGIELPVSFKANNENIIKVKFVRPTECYTFNQFYSESDNSMSTVAVETTVIRRKDGGCPSLQNNNVVTQNLKFKTAQTGAYTLKFWKGKDTNGEDLFLTYSIFIE